ncbi:YdbC family protein [Rossellomorea marisflavi]|uniref:YdbC family protein n=1 Tax=Rossellomorea marisflavi TaxID=189381 RepID=UPI0020407A7D|nr:YdbC family protein [Rossellomorea marisflavi]MCM2588054.1 YdbC family protein [Rossellomorea marisflavi]
MLVKRIVCTVEAHQRGSFHMAQMEWAALRTVEGFIAQLGGWDTSDASIAHIYSFWENRDRYENFMENIHDEIFGHSNQSATYTSIKIELFEGEASGTAVNELLRDCSLIRTSIINREEQPLNNKQSDETLLFSNSTGGTLLFTYSKAEGIPPWTAGEAVEAFMITEDWRVHGNDF